jgi:hypothetical protein
MGAAIDLDGIGDAGKPCRAGKPAAVEKLDHLKSCRLYPVG